MLPEPDRVRLRHMLDAAREAMRYAEGRSCAELESDTMLARALINCLAVVGEAAARIAEGTRHRDLTIPWAAIVGMRNRLIHAYFDIDEEEVWRTVTEDLQGLWIACKHYWMWASATDESGQSSRGDVDPGRRLRATGRHLIPSCLRAGR